MSLGAPSGPDWFCDHLGIIWGRDILDDCGLVHAIQESLVVLVENQKQQCDHVLQQENAIGQSSTCPNQKALGSFWI